MSKYFTKEQYKQLSAAIIKFGDYEEWKDTFGDTIRGYSYISDEIQLKIIYYENPNYCEIYTSVRIEDSWKTVTIIEEGSEKVNLYGKEYTFDELINLFPKSEYNEGEWLELL